MATLSTNGALMKIGELAERTATASETIRFYEREGLLPQAPRTAANYRVYGPVHQARLLLIRRCRALDMSLDEIRALLQLHDAPEQSCAAVNALLDTHLGHVTERIRELTALQVELIALRARCTEPARAVDCGILGSLGEARQTSSPAKPHVAGSHRAKR